MNKPFNVGGAAPSPSFGAGEALSGRVRTETLLSQYLKVLLKRKWLVLGVTAACLVAGLVITLLMTPQYTASATLEIKRENFAIVEGGVEPESNSVDMEFYETQYGLLRARSVATRIAGDLNLANNAEFFALFGNDAFEEELADGSGNRDTADARLRQAVDTLLQNMEVIPRPFSRLVEITFTSPDPQLSTRIVNAWTEHFIEATLARRFDATSYARNFLEERLGQLRERLEASERSAVDYAVRQELISVPTTTNSAEGGTTLSERPLVADDLTALNNELTEATADRIQAESQLRTAGGTVAAREGSSALPSMRERRSTLAADYANMLVQFEPQYPPAMALMAQIEELDRSIAREEARLRSTSLGSLQDAYNSAAQRESQLHSQVNALKDELMDLRSRTIQYNILQRDVDTNRQLYDGLLQRYKEIGIAGGVGVNNIAAVDLAEVPAGPSSPNLILNIALSLLAGMGLGVLLAFVLEQFNDVIGNPEEITDKLQIPLLGAVPKFSQREPLEELEDPKSAASEAYLSVKASLALATEHGVPWSLVVTSARPAEGKSTTAIALARSLARAGSKVLLIDGDMRMPSLHKKLDLENKAGLSNILAGDENWTGYIRDTGVSDLSVLSAGPSPPNAAELINSTRLRTLLDHVRREFDHCIIDGPPVMGLADAPLLCNAADGTVFVVQALSTGTNNARIALSRLAESRARVLGAVLTKFDAKRAGYGYGYAYEYSYGRKEQELV